MSEYETESSRLRSIMSCSAGCMFGSQTWQDDHVFRTPPQSTQKPADDDKRRASGKQIYTPLQPSQTRIVKLLRGDFHEDVRCELFVSEILPLSGMKIPILDEDIQYTALSYSWGYPEFVARIVCNGIESPVTQHMADALRFLRGVDVDFWIWIDAFCIDQYNIDEKSRQVQQMLSIYKNAQDVVAWLGAASIEDWRLLRYHPYAISDQTSEVGNLCQSHHEELTEHVPKFFAKPWFRRTWVRQEMYASRNATVRCSDFRTSCEELEHGYWMLTVLLRTGQDGIETAGIRCFKTYGHHHHALKKSILEQADSVFRGSADDYDIYLSVYFSAIQWFEVMIGGHEFDVSDEKDRVYAMIGMLLDSTPVHLRPASRGLREFDIDYRKSTNTVFLEMTCYLLTWIKSYLSLGIFEDRSQRRPGLPTWSIDFGIRSPRYLALTPAAEKLFNLSRTRNILGADGSLIIYGHIYYYICSPVISSPDDRDTVTLYSDLVAKVAGVRHSSPDPDDIGSKPNVLLEDCSYRMFEVCDWEESEQASIAAQPDLQLAAPSGAQKSDMVIVSSLSPVFVLLRLIDRQSQTLPSQGRNDARTLTDAEPTEDPAVHHAYNFVGPLMLFRRDDYGSRSRSPVSPAEYLQQNKHTQELRFDVY